MFYHVFSYLASAFDNNSSLEPIILWHDTINSAAIHISLISVHKIIEEKTFPRKFNINVLYVTDSKGKLKQIAKQFGRKKRIVMNYHGDLITYPRVQQHKRSEVSWGNPWNRRICRSSGYCQPYEHDVLVGFFF